jgi:photosystem II stability/assembly factor-like uncharacterized protein
MPRLHRRRKREHVFASSTAVLGRIAALYVVPVLGTNRVFLLGELGAKLKKNQGKKENQ